MSEPWEDFAPTETAVETAPWDDFKPSATAKISLDEEVLKEPSAWQAFRMSPVGRKVLGPTEIERESMAGQPAGIAGLFEPALKIPTLPKPSETPTTKLETFATQATPLPLAIKTAFGQDVATAFMRESYNVAKGLAEFPTSLGGAVSLMAGAAYPVTTAAVFEADLLKNMVKEIPELWNNWDKMSPEDKAQGLARVFGTAGMMGGIAHGGLTLRGVQERLATEKTEAAKLSPTELGWRRLKENISNLIGRPTGLPEAPREPLPLPMIPPVPPATKPELSTIEALQSLRSKYPTDVIENAFLKYEQEVHGLNPSIIKQKRIVGPSFALFVKQAARGDQRAIGFLESEAKPPLIEPEKAAEVPPPAVPTVSEAEAVPEVPSFAARYDPETLLQRPAWIKPGSAFDKVLGDLREKLDPFADKDITGIWKSLTPEQRQDLAARGWVPGATRQYGQVTMHLASDAVAAKKYYGVQNRIAQRELAKPSSVESGKATVEPSPEGAIGELAKAAPVVAPTEAAAPAISEVKPEAKEVQAPTLDQVNERLVQIASELKDLRKGFVTGATKKSMEGPLKYEQTRLMVQKQLLESKQVQAPIGPGAKTTGEQPYAAIKQLTDQLNAAPPVGEAQALPWRERVATAWAKGKSAFEGAWAKAMAITPTIRDAARGVRDVTDLDRRVGTLDYLLQRSAGQSRENGKAIMRQMPNKAMREAVAIWIDSGGDETAIRNTLATLKPSIKPNVRRALEQAANLPPEARQFAEQLKQFFGIREQDAIASDVFQQGLEDYYTHIWEREQNMPEGLRVALSNGKVNDYFQFARQRKISTFLQGIQYGMNPKLDPAKVVPYYNYALDRAIASREFIKRLTEMDAPDGRPAVLPNGTAVPVEKGDTPGALIINPRGKTELGKDYLLVNHPSMRKWKWMGTDEKGNPILYRGDLAVNPLLHERLSRMLDRTRLTPTKWGAAALRASAEVKGFKLGFLSAFHQVHVGSHALWHWTLPFRTEVIDWDAPNVRFAIEKGHLKIAADPSNLSQFSEDIMGQGLVHKLPMVGPWAKAYSEWLFGDYIPQLKVKTFQNAYDRNLKAYAKDIQRGKTTEEQIAARVGDSINNAYGELNHWFLGKYGRAPEFQRILRAIFLAPDFGEARLRFTEKAFTKYGFEERLAFVTMFLTMYTAARVGNWLSHGDPEWEAKRMFQVKEGNKWYSMRSVAGDLVHALTNFGQFMYVRLNPLYSRTVSDVLFQRDVYGRKLSLGDMFKRLGEQVIPIQFGNLTRDDQTIWDSFITSMGLQSRHDMPQFEVSKVVREYMAKSSDPKLKAMAERMEQELFAPSDYRPLRQALKDGNLKKASEEYDKLIKEKGKKPSVISSALRPYAKTEDGYTVTKPIGPLSVSEWQKFKRTLTKPQLKELQQAEKERLNVYQNFIELMKTK